MQLGYGGSTRVLRPVAGSGIWPGPYERVLHHLQRLQSNVAQQRVPVQAFGGVGRWPRALGGRRRAPGIQHFGGAHGEQSVVRNERQENV